jgi:hypothetical protein
MVGKITSNDPPGVSGQRGLPERHHGERLQRLLCLLDLGFTGFLSVDIEDVGDIKRAGRTKCSEFPNIL